MPVQQSKRELLTSNSSLALYLELVEDLLVDLAVYINSASQLTKVCRR